MRAAWVVVLLAGCWAGSGEVDELRSRLRELELRVEDLEVGGVLSPEDAKEANRLATEARDLAGQLRQPEAKERWDTLKDKFPTSRPARDRSMRRLGEALDVVGTRVERLPDPQMWLTGSDAALDVAQGTTVVVFWEEWCPHCRREVPELQTASQALAGRVDFVGFTGMSKSSTEDKVRSFLTDNGVTFPMAKESEDLGSLFRITTIPAAAVIRDGTVVWRGNPGGLGVADFEKLAADAEAQP